jgi:DNA-binding LacI/PurR family transcriptional regulator
MPAPRTGTPTVSDVARAAGVSTAVVSRVLNGDERLRVRDATRARVRAAAEHLRYTPNTSARSLRLASSGAICLLVEDLSNPIHAASLAGAQASAERSGRVVLLADADELSMHPDRLRDMVASHRVDGLVMHLPGVKGDGALRRIAQEHVPTVVINSRVRGPAGCVILDDQAASALATGHLLDLGHRVVGVITALADSDRSRRRLQGVEMLLRDRGLSLDPSHVIEAGFSVAPGRVAGRKLLALRPRPSAVVVLNVMAAIGLLEACAEAGVRVPDELSVIGLIDTWVCEHTSPPLTVVEMPIRELGAQAVELLLEMIDGGPRKSLIVREPAPRLIVRSSTAPAAC